MFYNNTYVTTFIQEELIQWSIQKKQETINGIGSLYKYEVNNSKNGFTINKNRWYKNQFFSPLISVKFLSEKIVKIKVKPSKQSLVFSIFLLFIFSIGPISNKDLTLFNKFCAVFSLILMFSSTTIFAPIYFSKKCIKNQLSLKVSKT